MKLLLLLTLLGARSFAAVTTPNMNLQQPTIGVDSGLTWEQDVNANSAVIDQHNHTPGNGVAVPPAGLNINSNLSFQGNSATGLQASVYAPQISLGSLGAVYTIGADLYYNDFNGNVIQITSGGSVNATSSGIVNGSATASFVSSVLVVNAASNTPANIQGGSILLGNNVANSKFLTLSPPSSMASNFSLTLPSIPGAQNFLSIDSSGNIGAYAPIAGGITGSNIASATIAGSNIATNTVTQPNMLLRGNPLNPAGVGQVALSGNIATFTLSGTLFPISGASVTLTTLGNPVTISMVGSTSPSNDILQAATTASGGVASVDLVVVCKRGTTVIGSMSLTYQTEQASSNAAIMTWPIGSLQFTDFPAAGTYTYTLYWSVTTSGGTAPQGVLNGRLMAYEIK